MGFFTENGGRVGRCYRKAKLEKCCSVRIILICIFLTERKIPIYLVATPDEVSGLHAVSLQEWTAQASFVNFPAF